MCVCRGGGGGGGGGGGQKFRTLTIGDEMVKLPKLDQTEHL